jgi:nucleotide-binding universal stress UspA family protein
MSKRLVPISIRRILIAVDGSEHSSKAVELGIECAKNWAAEIDLIHVRTTHNLPKGFEHYAKLGHLPPDYLDKLDEHLLRPAEERAKAEGVKKIYRISVEGDPADEILKRAEAYDADLIVMGTSGLGTFSRAFLGSVSTKVLNHAKCTCIVVK